MLFTSYIVGQHEATSWRQELEFHLAQHEYNKHSKRDEKKEAATTGELKEAATTGELPISLGHKKELTFFLFYDAKLEEVCKQFDLLDTEIKKEYLKNSTNKHSLKYWHDLE